MKRRNQHSHGRGGGRGREYANGPADRERRIFTKLVRDKDATMSTIKQARRFLVGMGTFESKPELLAQLDDDRYVGKKRIADVVSFINSLDDVQMLFIPLIRLVMTEETNRHVYRPLRNRILFSIYNVAGLMVLLDDRHVASDLDGDSAGFLCSFLSAIAKAFIEPRESDMVASMAKELRNRGDLDEARVLCSFLMVDERDNELAMLQRNAALHLTSVSACWVSDMVPPGQRHDNDHLNFRNIQILPTVDELSCTVASYLPLANGKNRFIDDPVISLLDSNFRLLREDAVSTMRETLHDDSSRNTWTSARIIGLDVGNRFGQWGVSFVVQCDKKDGNPDWERNRAFAQGTVVALCDGHEHLIRLGTISIRDHSANDSWLNAKGGPTIGVVFDDDFEVCLAELNHNSDLNEVYKKVVAKGRPNQSGRLRMLVQGMRTYQLKEISKSFFSYRPILEALQENEGSPLLSDLVADSVTIKADYLPDHMVLPPEFGHEVDALSMNALLESTSLDKTQAAALYHTLNSRIAMVQGPPGTGKTYLGALVTRTIRNNTDETILCVCYTNHALDQFLENLLSSGETRLVRIGARSKNEKLEGYSLKNLAHHTKGEDDYCLRRIKQVTAQMFGLKERIEAAVAELLIPCHWDEIRTYLSDMDEDCLQFLQVPDSDDGFNIVGPGGKMADDNFLWRLWAKGDAIPDWILPHMDVVGNEYASLLVFWNLPLPERRAMIAQWKTEVRCHGAEIISASTEELSALAKEKKSLALDRELVILKQARIIGATTSGAAKYRDLLALASPNVVLVEEAGEVLEAHILTSLSTTSKHLIMIGDHLQLPPKVEQYNLSTTSGHGYNLDCSLFERLAKHSWPSVTLDVQRRMRPSISALIREQTYPNLKDHNSVSLYPDVKGVTENVMFVDHRHAEDGDGTDDLKSKSNLFEANLTIEIVRYFLLQGYDPGQIVVLTPYLGQLIKLVSLIKVHLREAVAAVSDRDMADVELLGNSDSLHPGDHIRPSAAGSVRCSSIDNFQGEEADIVVISLVRSNVRGTIGFLKEKQRVNVLLSRARHGMFIVGNSATLQATKAGRSAWDPVLQRLTEGGCIMDGFSTTCHLHPGDDPIILKVPGDFRTFRPNGGCNRPCNVRLECGHACPLFCHQTDRAHTRGHLLCVEPCKRFPKDCHQQHSCPKLCKEECGRCMSLVGCRELSCGHISDEIRCFEEHELTDEVLVTLLSGRCMAAISHTFPVCGHTTGISCVKSRSPHLKCGARCKERATCGHPCSTLCGICSSRTNHSCNQKCEKVLFCGHICGRVCHVPDACAPCEERCINRCQHSQCQKVCNEPCASCVEACDWACEHDLKCSLVCGAPCSRLPCNVRCSKVLECGHRCPSVCGEDCPDPLFCHECPGVNKTKVVDMICLTQYEDHDVDNDPIIVLPCKHFFAASTLDGHLQMNTVYKMDEDGLKFVGLKPLIGASPSVGKPPQCPECRSLIHSVRRYGRFLRLMELRSLERKHVMVVDRALTKLSHLVGDQLATPKVLDTLQKLELLIRRSPMRRVFEACGGNMEIAPPPSGPLIRCLELLGIAFAGNCKVYNDDDYVRAKGFFEAAIDVADESASNRSGAQQRVALSSLVFKHCRDANVTKEMVIPLLDWIIDHTVRFEDLIATAQSLKANILSMGTLKQQEIQEVLNAMGRGGGYDYGGTASSHWFECPNGHPYFIGECGGAMETSLCNECRLPIGGTSHNLLSTNRSVTGALHDALTGCLTG